MSDIDPLPLAGIRAVVIEQAVSAPFCSRQLADPGAEVIKIERPGCGDFARDYDHVIGGQSAYFAWLNRGKKRSGSRSPISPRAFTPIPPSSRRLAARGRWVEVDSAGGPIPALLPPHNLQHCPPAMGRVPALGEHTREVLDSLELP